MPNYLAITIGPIFSTLREARKTRELWAASYMFSRLMELLMIEVSKKEVGATVLVPQISKVPMNQRFGAGIYNDRLFAEIEDNDPEKVDTAINNALKQLAEELKPGGGATESDTDFWKKYFRIAYVIKPIKNLEKGGLFNELTHLLDAAELSIPYFSELPDTNPFSDFFKGVYQTNLAQGSIMRSHQNDAYGKLMVGYFPSTSDVASFEVFQKRPDEYVTLQKLVGMDENQDAKKIVRFFELLFKDDVLKKVAKDYHKYFCIVHADADNVSKLNEKQRIKDDYISISQKLGAFAIEAAKIINAYGGKPVYIGGDDLLFFAPVCMQYQEQKASVLQLIQELDNAFNTKGFEGSTLSFGITISYYKYPLYEARDKSYEQLTEVAKKVDWQTKPSTEKNAIAFRLLKHSGAFFEGVLSKSVLESFVNAEKKLKTVDKDLISGLIYKIETLDGLFNILKQKHLLDNQIEAIFENFFNEPIHKKEYTRLQLEQISKLILAESSDAFTIKGTPLKQNLYAILRLLDFVSGAADKKESARIEPNLRIKLPIQQ